MTVFEPASQGDFRAYLPRFGGETAFGKGLGLAFCRIAVEAHEGQIWVEDNHPQGSVFVARIPTIGVS
jgi:K+-sensing histidine kinase KdpD